MTLSAKTMKYIEELAHGVRKAIKDLEQTTTLSYDDAVRYVSFFGGKVKYRPGVNSEIVKSSDDSFMIYVSNKNIEEVFHEFGHAFLNWEQIGDEDTRCAFENDGSLDYNEQAASFFMRSFIMPTQAFVEQVLEVTYNNVCDFKLLSEKFNVSKYTVISRGNDIGIWA